MSTETTQREEFAHDVFLADNSNALPNVAEKDWDENREHHDYAFEIADRMIAAGYRKPRTITTIGDMAGLADRSVFRTAEGHVFEVQGGHLLRTDSTTWWSPLASWLPITVLDEPAATCTGADSCEAIAHVHGCFAEATR